MDIDDIPQDDSKSYNGLKKIVYGTRGGHYQAATSTGWQDESYATEMAVAELDAQTEAARLAVLAGNTSPLYFHMLRYRHDEASLAMAAGVWQWQLRRHLKPQVFARLSGKTLQKYADALQISVAALKSIEAV
ncbi:hypothetical protein ACM67B_06720 [Neisseria sp. CCUG17229]|uniref:hypothetical protein n=1 Tax=Neisseria sp. CCUG17229 TaxID=3392036 RepID=UPI003A0FC99F